MHTFKNILVTTDLSENGQAALPFAVAMAQHHQAKLHLLYVEDLDVIYLTDRMISLPQLEWTSEERKKHEHQVKESLVRELKERDHVEIVPYFKEGDPSEVIVETAREVNADCIVMSSHGRSGLSRVLFGSVTEDVLRHSPCPVLCVKAHGLANASESAPILMPTDLSNESLESLPFAAALAKQQGAKLHVLLVLEDKLQISNDASPKVEWLVREHRQMEQKLQEFAAQLRKTEELDVAPHLLHGMPANLILSFAAEIKAGCIVIASHGRSGLKRLLVGSVAEEVIRNSKCPVLAIRNGLAQAAGVQVDSDKERAGAQ